MPPQPPTGSPGCTIWVFACPGSLRQPGAVTSRHVSRPPGDASRPYSNEARGCGPGAPGTCHWSLRRSYRPRLGLRLALDWIARVSGRESPEEHNAVVRPDRSDSSSMRRAITKNFKAARTTPSNSGGVVRNMSRGRFSEVVLVSTARQRQRGHEWKSPEA